ncbi:amidase [Methylopila jiangsuensis]|uniref:Amidase n=1 Tax=Methylopila jiangsuensis TaxID=586230 RepID=A0A9W6N4V5_9HYPH|nr:amidase [Methylopila jiangsuensis]MDR6284902.1 aspartyl-tRNA(Asn)/glutamyl-tRNA(Gln) amidotransferase subunit A [Methylopila jiangsuensis]GLK77710.1 amidase [Methylopila jiangsuensis]
MTAQTDLARPVAPAPANDDLARLSAAELGALYRAGKASPVEVLDQTLERIARLDPVVNAFALLDPEAARRDAAASEERWRRGAPLSPIDGAPATLKDLIAAKGWPTLRGSHVVDPEQAWDEDSPVTARLREAGAVLLGKTTTSEFGWTALADSPLTGLTRNPWDLSRTAGGSSGGAAASAALNLAPLNVATDGGGSTRLPAANSGAFGLKPTFGRVAGYPSAHTHTLFHVTPLTRTVADAALLLHAIARPDPRDWRALPKAPDDWLDGLDAGVAGLKIGFSPDLGYAEVDPEVAEIVARAAQAFEELGAHVEPVDLGLDDPLPVYRTLADAAVARLFANLPEGRAALADPDFRAVAERGRAIDAVTYLGAAEAREALGRRFGLLHERFHLLLTPTTAVPALPADFATTSGSRGVTPSPFAYPFNLTQQPAASVPAGLTRAGLPVGLQIVGPKYAEARVLTAATAFEAARPFARVPDPA